jgi:hypothetical protein
MGILKGVEAAMTVVFMYANGREDRFHLPPNDLGRAERIAEDAVRFRPSRVVLQGRAGAAGLRVAFLLGRASVTAAPGLIVTPED